MNILGLIFSLLLILSYGFYACWDKHWASTRLRTTYVGHEKVIRQVLNHFQTEIYEGLRGKGVHGEESEKEAEPAEKKSQIPELNRTCSKLNLWPLIQEGKENHPLLYALAVKMCKTFYDQDKRVLDALLKAAKGTSPLVLEKVDLHNPDLQRIYYKMLKGTKGDEYPSLLDYVKAEPSTQKICLFHAHPDLIALVFNREIADHLYEEIHRKDGPLLTDVLLERICAEHHQMAPDPALLALLELGRPLHEESKKTMIAEDEETHVALRKSFYTARGKES